MREQAKTITENMEDRAMQAMHKVNLSIKGSKNNSMIHMFLGNKRDQLVHRFIAILRQKVQDKRHKQLLKKNEHLVEKLFK